MAIVYQITNTVNGKMYVGYTSLQIEDRWQQHKYRSLKETINVKFYNAIRKYGTEVWDLKIICNVSTVEEAKEKEIFYIAFFDSYNNGYNSTKGGDGNNGIIMSVESNKKRSQALLGRRKSDETIEKFKARKQSASTCEAISKSHTGMKKPWVKWSNEQIVQRAMTRRVLTKEQFDEIQRLSQDGHSLLAISKQVGCSYAITKKWVKRSWDL